MDDVYWIMLTKKTGGERFAKVLMKLTTGESESRKETQRPPSQTSFLQEFSSRSDNSTRYTSQLQAQSPKPRLMDEARAIRILLEQPEVMVNKQVMRMRTEVVPTSNGIRYVLLLGEVSVNLSWLHSVQELEAGKILLLYYDLQGLGEGRAKLESLVLEMGRAQGATMLSVLNLMHGKCHDEEIEKLYHYLC